MDRFYVQNERMNECGAGAPASDRRQLAREWTPPLSRSIGIIELAENREEVQRGQYFAGKIFETLDLEASLCHYFFCPRS